MMIIIFTFGLPQTFSVGLDFGNFFNNADLTKLVYKLEFVIDRIISSVVIIKYYLLNNEYLLSSMFKCFLCLIISSQQLYGVGVIAPSL